MAQRILRHSHQCGKTGLHSSDAMNTGQAIHPCIRRLEAAQGPLKKAARTGPTLTDMTTSKKVASDAGKELRTQTSKKEKEVAASALAQSGRKGRKAKRK